MEAAVFLLSSLAAVGFALGTVCAARPIHSAACLLACLAALVPVYLVLAAPFVATVHLLVYAGAIMVLFMFVVMLLDERKADDDRLGRTANRVAGLALPLLLLGMLAAPLLSVSAGALPPAAEGFGTARRIGAEFLSRHMVAFEAVSLLLVVAMAAVVAFTRKEARA